jgi:hypothetical protein
MKNFLTLLIAQLLTVLAHLSGSLEQWACRVLHKKGAGTTYPMGVLDHSVQTLSIDTSTLCARCGQFMSSPCGGPRVL